VAKKRTRKTPKPKVRLGRRTLDARPDTVDFRDRMFVPTLIEVPTTRPLAEYRRAGVPILDQGTEGACTGFGLATVIHYLLRTRRRVPDRHEVSPRMLYNMARRYDEWPGENYSGSSARGAMKGWHKHGVCSSLHWRYIEFEQKQDRKLFAGRYEDALRRPLGAYFRVNHKDIIAMHAAMSEVGILYATAQVHAGWDDVGGDGIIKWTEETDIEGGHAFAIVAYDERGFWIQNSWADDWGKDGFARITYDHPGNAHDDAQVMYRPRHTAWVRAAWARGPWRMETSAAYTGKRYPNPGPVNALPGFWSLAGSAAREWRVGPAAVTTAVRADRLRDEKDALIFGYPEPGRRIRVDVSVRRAENP